MHKLSVPAFFFSQNEEMRNAFPFLDECDDDNDDDSNNTNCADYNSGKNKNNNSNNNNNWRLDAI